MHPLIVKPWIWGRCEMLLVEDAVTLLYMECTPVKTLLLGAVWKDLETLGSACNNSEKLAIQSRLKRYGHYHHQIRRQRLSVLWREGVRRKSLQGTQRKERDWSATHVGHVRFVYIVWPLWFWHLIGAKFHVAMVVHVICSCAFVTCAHRPPNRHETSLPYTRQCAVWNSRSDKIAKIYNQDSLQSAHTCNRTRASPADVTGVVNLRSRFASVVTCSRFVTRTSRDLPLCAS